MDILKMTGYRLTLRSLLLAMVLTTAAAHGADAGPTRSDQIKAATIYKFGRYIHWPEIENAPFNGALESICILGEDPYNGALQSLQSPTNTIVRAINGSSQTGGCQILIIGNSEQAILDQILLDLHGKRLVTISEIDGFTDRGGMIRLYAKNNRIRFDINQQAARVVDLRFDLRLTRLAAALVN